MEAEFISVYQVEQETYEKDDVPVPQASSYGLNKSFFF